MCVYVCVCVFSFFDVFLLPSLRDCFCVCLRVYVFICVCIHSIFLWCFFSHLFGVVVILLVPPFFLSFFNICAHYIGVFRINHVHNLTWRQLYQQVLVNGAPLPLVRTAIYCALLMDALAACNVCPFDTAYLTRWFMRSCHLLTASVWCMSLPRWIGFFLN